MTNQLVPSQLAISAETRFLSLAQRKIITYFLLILFGALFLWFNVRTSMSTPPWIDEVMQVDAGVNLHLGNGWTSTAWPQQSQYEFWAANNPLYTLLVYLWISIWHFSPVAVRSLNYVLVLLIAGVIVDACRRSGLVHSVWAESLMAALIIFNGAVEFVYKTGRADLVTMLVVALLFWTYVSVQHAAKRHKLLFLVAMFMLPSGLHAIPYTVLLLCLDFFITKKARLRDIVSIFLGGIMGGLLMALFFFWMHSLKAYIIQTFASAYNILGSAMIAAIVRDNVAVTRFLGQIRALSPASVLRVIAHDTSALPLIVFLFLVVLLLSRHAQSSPAKSTAVAGLIGAALVPYGMLAAGRYPFYYAWMGAAPVIVAFTICVERSWPARQRVLLISGLLAAIAAVTIGVKAELLPFTDASIKYSEVQELLAREAWAGDAVYGDPVLYYAAKTQRIPFLTLTYASGRSYPHMTDAERSRITILIVRPEDLSESFNKVGGAWTKTTIRKLSYGFSLVVCRRVGKELNQH